MKKIRMKVARILAYVYGLGITVTLFVGALTFLGYLIAIVIGGETAADICTFIYRKIYPVLFYTSSASVLIGLLKMYMAGEKSMIPNKKK